MFKKSIAIILTAVMVLSVSFSAFAAIGDIIGMACHTDIVARINGYDIPSFNVNGNTYIVAEDLVDYGFNVYWNGDARTLTISRNPYATAITSGYIKPAISPDMVGTKSYDILLTDIATYADSDFIGGYNINGMTIIPFDELARYGNVAWDGVKRRITLDMPGIESRPDNPAPTTGYIDVYYAGFNVYSGNLSAFFCEGEIMVPFEHTFKVVSMAEDWMEFWNDGNTSYFTGGDSSFAFTEGNNTAFIYRSDGSSKPFYMSVAPVRINGVLYIPLRTYCEMTDKVMNWNDSYTAIYLKNSFDTGLSPDEARDLLKRWIGDLGTWQTGQENFLSFNGEYYINGKIYYQYQLKGWVQNHTTTLTWYVVSSDGNDIFEGMCSNGVLNRW